MNEANDRRTIVISGGTDGMGRALALSRARRGDSVIAIGSNPQKGERLLADARENAPDGSVEFLRADLTTVRGTDAAVSEISERTTRIDALALFANRQYPRRTETNEGLESTFALYYLSRYLLGEGLTSALGRSSSPVIVNVAGVGTTKGSVNWDDPQSTQRYSMVGAQLQAGRANDLLGVGYAAAHGGRVPYVLYHPGFTRSGDLTPLPAPLRVGIRVAARLSARPIEDSIAAIHEYIDAPPTAALTARDRAVLVPLDLPTLDPTNAQRLAEYTERIVDAVRERERA